MLVDPRNLGSAGILCFCDINGLDSQWIAKTLINSCLVNINKEFALGKMQPHNHMICHEEHQKRDWFLTVWVIYGVCVCVCKQLNGIVCFSLSE